MNISELSLGINKPLLPAKPLGQTSGKAHDSEIFVDSNLHNLNILSSTGKTVLAAISQAGEEESVETRPVENQVTNNLSTTVLEVTQAQSFPQLPLKWQDLNTIISLGQFQGLGKSSIQSLQVLNLTPETSVEQELAEFSLGGSENDQNYLPESSLSPLKSTFSKKSNSDLHLENKSASQTTPTAWSSLAELIGEDGSVSSQDSDDEDIEGFMFTPEGFRPIYANPIKTSGDVADSIEAETQMTSGTNQTPIETMQPSVTVAQSSQSTEPELASESNLRILAQEVYKLVRQRLQIERERYRR
jgi:hypothetical protein